MSADRFAENERLNQAVREHQKHLANYATQYDGKGGVKWQDDGGLRCNCGWTAPRASHGRPWSEWHRHVVAAVASVLTPAGKDRPDERP